MKNLKPIFIENSKLPYWLSKIAPIDVWAFSAGPFVVCRGELSEKTITHETIHFFQQVEMLFVFQWILYGLFYIIGRFTKGSWKAAYYGNPFEVEAYANDIDPDYLQERKFWAWTGYVKSLFSRQS
tara:strand:- start:229 stop:606 length:378 start_codon:yes stop_codon:yes gene_type:complete